MRVAEFHPMFPKQPRTAFGSSLGTEATLPNVPGRAGSQYLKVIPRCLDTSQHNLVFLLGNQSTENLKVFTMLIKGRGKKKEKRYIHTVH